MNIIIKLEKRNGTFDGHNRCSKGFNDCCKEILVPKGVPLLALTATATITLRKEICAILGMKKTNNNCNLSMQGKYNVCNVRVLRYC